MKGVVKRLLPWLISLALVGYLAWTTDLVRFWAAVRNADLGLFILVALVGVASGFLWDAACLTALLRRFNAPVTYTEMLPLKGASYFLNILNYNAAAGGMAYHLKRTRGVPFLEGASSFLFMNVADLLALALLGGLGVLLSGDALQPEARVGLVWTIAAVGAAVVGTWIYWNAGFDFFVLGRVRRWRIFHAFREARLRDYAWLTAMRIGLIVLYVVEMWLFLLLFDFDISLGAVFALHPIVILVWTLPVSVMGLGTTQLAMRMLFAPFAALLALAPHARGLLPVAGGVAPDAALRVGDAASQTLYFDAVPQVDACSTAMIVATVTVRVLIGYVFLKRVSDEFMQGAASRRA